MGHSGKGPGWVVALLNLESFPPNSAIVDPRRRTRLKATKPKSGLFKPLGQAKRRGVAISPGRDLFVANMNHATQEGASGENHCGGRERDSTIQDHAGYAGRFGPPGFNPQIFHRTLANF
jgi:hypothetical protein